MKFVLAEMAVTDTLNAGDWAELRLSHDKKRLRALNRRRDAARRAKQERKKKKKKCLNKKFTKTARAKLQQKRKGRLGPKRRAAARGGRVGVCGRPW